MAGALLVASLASSAGAATATLQMILTNNGEPLEQPTYGKFFVFEPEEREKYVAWGHADKIARFPEGTYDLVIRYENDLVRRDIVREKIAFTGNRVEQLDFGVDVAKLVVDLTAGGTAVSPYIGRYDIYPAGTRGKPAASRRPGEAVTIRPGLYDIEATVVDSRGLQTFSINAYDLHGSRRETIEIGEPPAQLRLTILRDGAELPSSLGRWRVYRQGNRGTYVVERGSGESANLEPGVYDVRMFYREGPRIAERWLEGLRLRGTIDRRVELSVEGTRLTLELHHAGSRLSDAWCTLHPAGDRTRTVSTAKSGESVDLPAGTYDIGCFLKNRGLRAEEWLSAREISGDTELEIELDPRPATLRVKPPRTRSRHRESATPSALVLLDSSLEMAQSVGGRERLELVRRTLAEVAAGLQRSSLRLGVRVFGITPRSRRNCEDSSLIWPVQSIDGPQIARTLDLLRPTGFSPIAHSLQRVNNDLPENGGGTLVLITGSLENCGGDVCAEATRLLRRGIAGRIAVVAVGLDREKRRALECIGEVYAVDGRRQLRSTLREILADSRSIAEGSVSIFESGWDVFVTGGALDEQIDISSGRYDVLVRTRGKAYVWENLTIAGELETVAGPSPKRR